MPKYKVRLESPDHMRPNGDPHFRVSSLEAEDEDDARQILERMEYKKAAYQLPDDQLAEHEQAEADALDADPPRKPDAQIRMRLAVHRQQRPYEIVEVEEVA